AAAAAVWFAGVRLAHYADAVTERTGLGEAFVGALVLGGITSLPEVATTVTASLLGNAALAVNNVFGGVAMQVVVLALADLAVGSRPLSSLSGRPIILLQGVLVCGLLGIAIAGITVGEPSGLPVGAWSAVVLVVAVGAFYLMQSADPDRRWEAKGTFGADNPDQPHSENDGGSPTKPADGLSNEHLTLRMVGVSLIVLVAGFVVARTGDAIAAQTGLGSGLIGFALVAISTSLPEVSTTLTAARFGAYGLAFSNIFGTNVFDVALIFVADLFYPGGPVLNEVGSFAVLGAVLGQIVTLVYLAGIIERRDFVIGRLGPDSLIVILVYSGGLVLLYRLSGG
ncbi:MAG: sodium:calcium antiporter, partial [Chloroflexota bacterium]